MCPATSKLCVTIRNQRKYSLKKVAEYEMVNDPEGEKNIKSSKASAVTTKPFIDVHDRSENEKDTEVKFSVKNSLYERGTCIL